MAGAVLCFVLADCCCDLRDGVLDREPPRGEIHAVPFQPQDLAPAQAVQGGDLYEGICWREANRNDYSRSLCASEASRSTVDSGCAKNSKATIP